MEFRRYLDKRGVSRKEWKVICEECSTENWIRTSKSRALKRKICFSCSNSKSMAEDHKSKISETLRNKYKIDPEFKKRVIEARNVASGENHWNWKGGVTPLNQKTRTSKDAGAWRLAVFYRDNYQCRMCGSKNNLQAHHINSWANFPEDRFVLENGMTLCKKCHDFYHRYEKEARNNCCSQKTKRSETPADST